MAIHITREHGMTQEAAMTVVEANMGSLIQMLLRLVNEAGEEFLETEEGVMWLEANYWSEDLTL